MVIKVRVNIKKFHINAFVKYTQKNQQYLKGTMNITVYRNKHNFFKVCFTYRTTNHKHNVLKRL